MKTDWFPEVSRSNKTVRSTHCFQEQHRKGAVAKPEDKQPCKGDRTKPGVNRLKVCAAPGIDKKNNIKPCKGDRIKFVQAVFSNAPTELQG